MFSSSEACLLELRLCKEIMKLEVGLSTTKHSANILLVPKIKCEIVMVLSNYSFFKYCEKSPILLSQYYKNYHFKRILKIILHYGAPIILLSTVFKSNFYNTFAGITKKNKPGFSKTLVLG